VDQIALAQSDRPSYAGVLNVIARQEQTPQTQASRKTAKPQVREYILHEDKDFVVIASLKSLAITLRLDEKICLDCPHRGTGHADRTCYVGFKVPLAIWNAHQRGIYPRLDADEYAKAFSSRKVRFDAYGEPVLIPLKILAGIAAVAKGWTGYTHQWRKAEYAGCRLHLMASCDSPADYLEAAHKQWRPFHVRTQSSCLGKSWGPANPEGGNKSQCNRCGLCNSMRTDGDKRKSIKIIVHGVRSKHFVGIGEIKAPA
jgi:hypothetical protein